MYLLKLALLLLSAVFVAAQPLTNAHSDSILTKRAAARALDERASLYSGGGGPGGHGGFPPHHHHGQGPPPPPGHQHHPGGPQGAGESEHEHRMRLSRGVQDWLRKRRLDA